MIGGRDHDRASSSATVSLGGGCDLALESSAQVSVTPVDGSLCVRMIEEPVSGFSGDRGGVLLAGAGALTVGGRLLIGLGLSGPASGSSGARRQSRFADWACDARPLRLKRKMMAAQNDDRSALSSLAGHR